MADMNPGIILAGRSPNIFGAYNEGLQVAQNEMAAQQQNALAALYQQQGPQIAAGEPNALAALARQDPAAAFGMQQAQQGMAFEAERMGMARDQARRMAEQASREAEAWAAGKTAEERAAAKAEADAALASVVIPHAQTIIGALGGDPAAVQQLGQVAAQYGMTPEQFIGQAAAIDSVASVLKGVADLMPEPVKPQVGALPQGSYMVDPSDPSQGLATIPGYEPEPVTHFRPATPEEAARYGAAAGQFGSDGRFYPINPPTGMSITTNPDGTVSVTQGAGAGAAAKEQKRADSAATATDVITAASGRALAAYQGLNLGPGGVRVVGMLPWTDSAELKRQIDVLKANASVTALNAMRAASPTGGALGSPTEKEHKMLADMAGALDPDSPNFARDVADYTRTLLRTVHGVAAGDVLFSEWLAQSGLGSQAAPAATAAPGSGSQTGLDEQTLQYLDPETRAWLEEYLSGTSN